jgi:hypothetical protein
MSRASGAAQVVELLSSKRKALSSTPKAAGKKNFKNKNFKFPHAAQLMWRSSQSVPVSPNDLNRCESFQVFPHSEFCENLPFQKQMLSPKHGKGKLW